MAKLGETSQSLSSTTSPSEEGELSICFCATAENCGIGRFTEWYVFNISNNDFKYRQEKLPKIKKRRFGDDFRSVLEERICVEGHHHRGDGIYGMRKLTPISTSKQYSQQTLVALGSTVYCLGGESVRNPQLFAQHPTELFRNQLQLGQYPGGQWGENARQFTQYPGGQWSENAMQFTQYPGEAWHNEFLHLDLKNPSDGWKSVTPMIARRSNPNIVVLDEKLYALSGVIANGGFEVYDPMSGDWEALPEPPFRQPIARLIALDSPNRIVVVSLVTSSYSAWASASVYVYDVEAKSWEEARNSRMSGLGKVILSNFVVVDHTLYWFTKRTRKVEICAYDLDQGMWFLGHIRGPESNFGTSETDHQSESHNGALGANHQCFLHLGGDMFCLLWADIVDECDSDSDDLHPVLQQSQLHCLKLRVSIGTNDKFRTYWSETTSSLNVTIESCQSYFIDHRISLKDALLLNGKLGKEDQLDEASAIGRHAINVHAAAIESKVGSNHVGYQTLPDNPPRQPPV